jgi:flagellar biosynthetic protein FliR
MATLNEIMIGLSLGFVLQLSFAAPTIAAEVIGASMGMSIATAADPSSGAHSPALGQYFAVVLTVLFLGLGAHLNWIALIVESYRAFPPGSAWFAPGRFEIIMGFGSVMFATALSIALPVTLLLLLVQVMTGVISRSAPSLNLFSLGLPAGILAGLVALIAAMPLLTDRLEDLSAAAVTQAGAMIAAGAPRWPRKMAKRHSPQVRSANGTPPNAATYCAPAKSLRRSPCWWAPPG